MKADYLKLVRESIDRMEQSMDGRLRMDEFAAAAHYSYPHFARVFLGCRGDASSHVHGKRMDIRKL